MHRHAMTHDLRVLFDQLDSNTQKNIIDDTGKMKSKFNTRLDTMRNAFVEFRYHHQTKKGDYP